LGLFCSGAIFTLVEGQVTHTKMSEISKFWKVGQKKDTSDGPGNTHEIPGKFCLHQNGKRDSPELSLLPLDCASTERKFYFMASFAAETVDELFPRFGDQHSGLGTNSTFYTAGFRTERRTLSFGHVEDLWAGPGSGPW